MIAGKRNILIQIDKKAQAEKMSKEGSIYIHPQHTYMQRYLQYGEIVDIGSIAKQEFPQAEVGDTAIFHHTIEDGDARLVTTLADGDEIRYIDGSNENMNYEIFGILKPDGTLIPCKYYIFSDTVVKPFKKSAYTSDFLVQVSSDFFESEEKMKERIADLELQEKSMAESFAHLTQPLAFYKQEVQVWVEAVENAINSIREEREKITKHMHAPKYISTTALHINPIVQDELKIKEGDAVIVNEKILYPFDIEGNKFFLILGKLLEAIKQ